MLGNTNKSIAAMCGAWLRRNVLQLWPDGSSFLAMYLVTVDWVLAGLMVYLSIKGVHQCYHSLLDPAY
jgi:hypothetical protein